MKFKAVSFALLLSFSMLNGIKSDCNYDQDMETGRDYYVYNSEYPEYYEGENHCSWRARSPYTIKINCTDIDIPSSNDCTEEYLSIQFDGSKERKFCGYGTYFEEGNNVTIKLDTTKYAKGGRFLCQLKTEKSFDEYNCQCGWKRTTKIVGGKEAGINEYTMMAALCNNDNEESFCGATIISSKLILTAAHCLQNRNIDTVIVRVGEHDTTTDEETDATKSYRIKNCIIHPEYRDLHNDIAICELDGTIEFNAKVGPVCLPFQHRNDSFGGVIALALGWGLLEFGGAKATKLQEVDLNVLNYVTCQRQYYNDDIDTNNVCTYTEGKDTCQMDSGGPLIWQSPTTKRCILIAVTIGGVGCATDVPGVYTRVGAYIDWIQSCVYKLTPGAQICKAE